MLVPSPNPKALLAHIKCQQVARELGWFCQPPSFSTTTAAAGGRGGRVEGPLSGCVTLRLTGQNSQGNGFGSLCLWGGSCYW